MPINIMLRCAVEGVPGPLWLRA